MDAKPRWRTWAEPLRRDGRNGSRNGRETRPRFANDGAADLNNPPTHSTLLDCCIATGGVALALLLRKALDPLLGPAQPFVTFYFAIFAAAWFGGALPGLLSAILSALAGWDFFIHLHPIRGARSFGTFMNVAMFSGVSSLAIVLTEAYRYALRRAENADEKAQLAQEEIARQIAERNVVERSLRLAEDRFACVIDANVAGMMTIDADGAIEHANAA